MKKVTIASRLQLTGHWDSAYIEDGTFSCSVQGETLRELLLKALLPTMDGHYKDGTSLVLDITITAPGESQRGA